MEKLNEKKVTIKANGVEVTLEGYSTQEVSRILTGQQEQAREINLNELLNTQKKEYVRITPLTIVDEFRHLVDTEEQRNQFIDKPIVVSDPERPFYKVISII